MSTSKYGYLNEKLGDAVRAMMIPGDNATAIASAMHSIQLAARDLTIEDDEVAEGWRKQLMETIGEGAWQDTAESMNELERHDFAKTTWELSAWAHREFWGSSS